MKACIQTWREICSSEPLSRLPSSAHETTLGSLLRSLFRARSWPQPSNWARKDWDDHFRQIGICIAVQAVEDHGKFADVPDVPVEAYLYQRVIGTLWTEYRREWRFSCRCQSLTSVSGVTKDISEEQPTLRSCHAEVVSIFQELDLTQVVDELPDQHRHLLVRIFWNGETEAEVAKDLKITPSGIHRRKAKALEAFRSIL